MIASLPAETVALEAAGIGRVQIYRAGNLGERPPALLVHTVNAAGNAYEVKPVFDALSIDRHVVAPDLPGFGASERSDRLYTPRLMTDAVLLASEELFQRTGRTIDLFGVSLGCEFVARAAVERPNLFRTLTLVSPTGFQARRDGPDGSTKALPAFYAALRALVGDVNDARLWHKHHPTDPGNLHPGGGVNRVPRIALHQRHSR